MPAGHAHGPVGPDWAYSCLPSSPGTGKPWSWRPTTAEAEVENERPEVPSSSVRPFAANGGLAMQRWRIGPLDIGLGEQLRPPRPSAAVLLPGRTASSARRLTLHLPQSWPWQEKFPRPSPAPSHSTPSLTALVCHRPAQRTTEIPANSRHHGPRAVPSVTSVLSLPPRAHRRPSSAPPMSACRPPGDLPPTRIQGIIAPVTPHTLPLSSRRPPV